MKSIIANITRMKNRLRLKLMVFLLGLLWLPNAALAENMLVLPGYKWTYSLVGNGPLYDGVHYRTFTIAPNGSGEVDDWHTVMELVNGEKLPVCEIKEVEGRVYLHPSFAKKINTWFDSQECLIYDFNVDCNEPFNVASFRCDFTTAGSWGSMFTWDASFANIEKCTINGKCYPVFMDYDPSRTIIPPMGMLGCGYFFTPNYLENSPSENQDVYSVCLTSLEDDHGNVLYPQPRELKPFLDLSRRWTYHGFPSSNISLTPETYRDAIWGLEGEEVVNGEPFQVLWQKCITEEDVWLEKTGPHGELEPHSGGVVEIPTHEKIGWLRESEGKIWYCLPDEDGNISPSRVLYDFSATLGSELNFMAAPYMPGLAPGHLLRDAISIPFRLVASYDIWTNGSWRKMQEWRLAGSNTKIAAGGLLVAEGIGNLWEGNMFSSFAGGYITSSYNSCWMSDASRRNANSDLSDFSSVELGKVEDSGIQIYPFWNLSSAGMPEAKAHTQPEILEATKEGLLCKKEGTLRIFDLQGRLVRVMEVDGPGMVVLDSAVKSGIAVLATDDRSYSVKFFR